MNFDEAVLAHSKWKMRLLEVAMGLSKESLDPEIVGADNKCALGQWIHGEAKQKYSQLSEYLTLIEVHASFHQCASSVLRMALSGQAEEAKIHLNTGGSFMGASTQTITAIRRLQRKVGNL